MIQFFETDEVLLYGNGKLNQQETLTKSAIQKAHSKLQLPHNYTFTTDVTFTTKLIIPHNC